MVKVNGIECSALVDTGSQVSLISEDFCRQNELEIESLNTVLRIEGIGGHLVSYIGYVEVNVEFTSCDGTGLVTPMLVLPGKCDPCVILGTNLLKDVPEWTKMCQGSKDFTGKEEAYCRVTHSVTIPPLTRKYIDCAVVGRVLCEALIEHGENLPNGVLVTPSVCSVNDGQCVLQINNFGDRSITISPTVSIAKVRSVALMEDEQPHQETSDGRQEMDKEEFLKLFTLPDCHKGDELERLQNLLYRNRDIFSVSEYDIGRTSLIEHPIRLTDETPFKEAYRRIPPSRFDEIKKHLNQMLEIGVIRPSCSPFSSPIVLVPKKDKTIRFCIDLRKLNNRTVKDAFALPRLEDAVDSLQGSKWFTKLDLRSGYWQIEMREEDIQKTAFSVGPLGHFECVRMPFGLTNAPSTFQRLMQMALGDLLYSAALVFLDDILVYATSIDQHMHRLNAVFSKLRQAGLKLKPSKCSFLEKKVIYLGHQISEDGVEADVEKLQAVKDWPTPTNKVEVKRFLGFAGFYRRFVRNFSQIARPLHHLLKQDVPFCWGREEEKAFTALKEASLSPPVLAFADWTRPFIVYVDASGDGLGAMLAQIQDGQEKPIAFASRSLNSAESRYHSHKLEFLALKWAVTDKFSDYLAMSDSVVKTDNNPLTYVTTTSKLDATGQRWVAKLANYNFTLEYLSGKTNKAADALSRLKWPVDVHVKLTRAETQPTTLNIDKDWKSLQDQDLEIATMKECVESGTFGQRPKSISFQLWRQRDKIRLKDNLLYRKRNTALGEIDQLCLPQAIREEALKFAHNELGHVGREKVLETLQHRFYWPGMSTAVSNYLNSCTACLQGRRAGQAVAPLMSVETSRPLELLCIDFLTIEEPKGKVVNILVAVDHFTKFGWAIPTANQRATTTAKALWNNLILPFGFMDRIHSDQGRNFESAVFKGLCKMGHISRSRTTPYHPMGNGAVEKLNGTLISILRTLSDEKKKKWKEYLPSTLHAYNVSTHQSTALTPFFLMFGRQPRLPLDIAFGLTEETSRMDYPAYVMKLRERLQDAYKVASERQVAARKTQKKRYDKKVKGYDLEVGSRVLRRNVTRSGKLDNYWHPEILEVTALHGKSPVYTLLELGGDKTYTLHRNLLLPMNKIPSSDVSSASEESSEEEDSEKISSRGRDSNDADVSDSEGESQVPKRVLRKRVTRAPDRYSPG